MRRLGLVRASPGVGRPVFAAADWLRLAVAPLAAAVRWQQRWQPQSPPVAAPDLETALLLILPGLRRLTADPGSTEIAVRALDEDVVSCVLTIESRPTAWAQASAGAWISTILGRDSGLELGGDTRLAAGMVEEIRKELGLA